MPRWMITCREHSELISKSMDCRLSVRDRVLTGIHSWICLPCGYLKKQFGALRQACRWKHAQNRAGKDRKGTVLSEEVRKRIQFRVNQQLK